MGKHTSSDPDNGSAGMTTATKVAVALTLMAAGRAMTLGWIARAGDGGPGDPPDAWLMPLIGDAVVGIAALVIAGLLVWRPTLATWTAAIAWTSIAAFDALAAYVVDVAEPWPEFFMLEIFGRPMFFAAAAMHAVILYLLTRPEVRARYGVGVAAPAST